MDYLVILNIKEWNKDKHDYSNMCNAVSKLNVNKTREPMYYDGCLFVWHLTSELKSEEIYNKLVTNVVENDDSLLVIEVNRENIYGYGKSTFWIDINKFWSETN